MKIAFLNGCLEPGRDGVGDYTRSLAQECVRQGHTCCLIALNDRWLQEAERTLEQDIEVLRLPASLDWSERIRQAREMLDHFQPEWTSLQFVPYAFNPKGIVFGLSSKLIPLMAGTRLHIMFHELWIGEYVGASAKERFVGEVQKKCILQMTKQLKPSVIHTSNATYVARLGQHHVMANLLPMFGSIPVGSKNADDWLFPKFREAGLNISSATRSDFWLIGFFGSLHAVWPSEPLFTELREAAKKQKKHIVFLAIGRMGAGEVLWQHLTECYATEFTFLKLGEQTTDTVSEYLLSLDFGLATSPYSLIGKSSTVATMLEHGLSVIVNREDAGLSVRDSISLHQDPLYIRLDEHFQERMSASKVVRVTNPRLPEVTCHFLCDLQNKATPLRVVAPHNSGKSGHI